MGQQQWRVWSVVLVGIVLALGACASGTSSTRIASPTAGGTATPRPATGAYALVRNGELWARSGDGIAAPLTTLATSPLTATWGTIVWSPGQDQIAFVLRNPPQAPGDPTTTPSQASGSLFVLNVKTRALRPIRDGNTPVAVPLLGRHVAWLSSSVVLFTQRGVLYRAALNDNPSVVIVPGPRFVWEIALRGTTLYYSTVPTTTPFGSGVGELRRRDLSTGGDDTLIATLGPLTLPPQVCSAFVCPADPTTPFVPYAWDVSDDGTRLVYQSTVSPSPATTTIAATPNPNGTATPNPGPIAGGASTPIPTASPTTTPGLANAVYYLVVGKEAPQVLSRLVSHPELPVLRFAPNGQTLALLSAPARLAPGVATLPPQTLALDGAASPHPLALPAISTVVNSEISWAPDSRSLAVLFQPAPGIAGPTAVYSYSLSGGDPIILERNVIAFTWGDGK